MRAFKLHVDEIKLMINCPKCGEAVREEKAFCHNCGSPMDAAKANRGPMPDFGATIIEPPRRTAAQPIAPQTVPVAQPTGRELAPAPVLHSSTRVALPSQPDAQPLERRKSARKIGFGFVLLLLFLMFTTFVVALWLD